MSYWYCDTCVNNIPPGEYVYNCTICTDYDQCERCYKSMKTHHSHPMTREISFGFGNEIENPLTDMTSYILGAFHVYADRYCFGVRDMEESSVDRIYANSYSWFTYQTIGDRTKNFSHGLRNLIEPRECLGICAASRPEYLIADFACILHSITTVLMYSLLSDRERIYIINHTNIVVIVCDGPMLPIFIRLSSKCPTLRHLICMDPMPDSITETGNNDGPTIHYMGDIENNGSIKQYEYVSTKPNDCLTIKYTSGTSGFPKGVMISEQSFRMKFDGSCSPYTMQSVLLSYCPLAWSADRNAVFATFLAGGRTGFSTGDVSRLMEEIALVRPTSFTSSPSIWNKIYSEFKCELSLAINCRQMNPEDAEEQLLEKFSKLMPNRCKILGIGGAMVSPALVTFMKRCFPRCRILESYGSTECGGITFDNSLCSDTDYRLESVPEMGYTIDDKPFPRGELLIKSNEMFSGYINNPEETNAAVTEDGFFRTGDIVEIRIDENKKTKIYVIDRKKNFFKLANGQFVSPEFLQTVYTQSSFIEQIYIHGNPMENQVVAVIVPNREYAQAFADKHNLIEFDMDNPDQLFIDALMNDIRSIAAKESLGKHEIPSRLIIDFKPFTARNGLLTSSLKFCRRKLALYYADRLKSHHTIEERLQRILETTTGHQLSADHVINFMEIGGHSLAAVRMSRMIQDELGVDMPLDILFQSKVTLEQLADFVKNPSPSSFTSNTVLSKMNSDVEMDLKVTIGPQRTSGIESASMIFITGTTGFVGAFLLAELLTRYPSSCKFICLVRCNKPSIDPFDRICQNMSSLHLWKEEYRDRIIPLQGDLAQEKFGLDNQIYDKLAADTDLIFHCGAIVNFILPYNQLYGSNVFGTREIIRLACYTSTSIPVHYISTISVLSSDTNSSEKLQNGYAQSKWVAEKLIEKASRAGLPVNTYRLGLILADTKTGACNSNDFYTLLIATIMKVKCYPTELTSEIISGTPADIAARMIVDLSQNQTDTYGNIYEMIDKENVFSFESMQNSGLQIERVTYDEWQKRLSNETISNSSLKSIATFFADKSFHRLPLNTDRHRQTELNSSPLTNDYTIQWLNFILKSFAITQ